MGKVLDKYMCTNTLAHTSKEESKQELYLLRRLKQKPMSDGLGNKSPQYIHSNMHPLLDTLTSSSDLLKYQLKISRMCTEPKAPHREWRSSDELCSVVIATGPKGSAWCCIREGQVGC